MTVSDTLTYDETPPRRPGIDDILVTTKEQPAGLPPPNPRYGPTAEEANQSGKQIVALAKVTPTVVMSLMYDSASAEYEVLQFSAAGSDVAIDTFTPTRNAKGDISVTWPAETFPSPAAKPEVSANGTTPCLSCVDSISNGVRVLLETTGGPIDAPFTVSVY